MEQFLLHLLISYTLMGISAWIYLGIKDGFIEETTPTSLGVLQNVKFLVAWYIILVDIAVQTMQSDPAPQNFEENLEKAMNQMGGE